MLFEVQKRQAESPDVKVEEQWLGPETLMALGSISA